MNATAPTTAHPGSRPLPPDFAEIVTLRATTIERKLGYFGRQPLIVFGYCPAGGEVLWKDGRTSGFGAGAWRFWLEEILPHAAHVTLAAPGIRLGDPAGAGTHVLLVDRTRRAIYAAPRDSAEDYLASVYRIPRPVRRCLCAAVDCQTCTVATCPFAGGAASPFMKPVHDKLHTPTPASGRR